MNFITKGLLETIFHAEKRVNTIYINSFTTYEDFVIYRLYDNWWKTFEDKTISREDLALKCKEWIMTIYDVQDIEVNESSLGTQVSVSVNIGNETIKKYTQCFNDTAEAIFLLTAELTRDERYFTFKLK